jgi:hypothetical protein
MARSTWNVTSGLAAAVLAAASFAVTAGPASATHAWNNYHWARTANPFALKFGDNVGTDWDRYVGVAVATDWSASADLDATVVSAAINAKTCKPTAGMVQVCSAKYGYNGWLGVAQIWATGDHITQGTTKLNDSYYALSTYNRPEWRALVACQEIGHVFGLNHQDEVQTNPNLGTCMDYTNNPLGPPDNEHPNAHDYDELDIIYSHLDSSSTVKAAAVASAQPADDWGKPVRFTRTGKGRIFVKELSPTSRVVTFVTWVKE